MPTASVTPRSAAASNMDKTGFSLAVGVFIGNAVICPLLGLKSWKDGFFIGLIAAALVIVFYSVFKKMAQGDSGMSCGHWENADYNAAKNIRTRAVSTSLLSSATDLLKVG